MRIRKAFQGTVPENKILDTYSQSQTDTYSCNYVNSKTTGEILWTNSSPTSNFSSQNISISNLSSYTYIDIVYLVYKGNPKQSCQRHYYDETYKNGELMSTFTHNARGYIGTRQFTVNDDYIHFEPNFDFTGGYTGDFAIVEDNSWSIPYKIIGYK